MKKQFYTLLSLLVLGSTQAQAQIGIFASAIQISTDGGATKKFYNTNKLVGDPNAIGSVNFQGSLGTFAKFDGKLRVHGGEIKTFKGNNDNICGGTLNWRVFPVGNPGGAFTQVDLGFFAGCASGTFSDGQGPCSGNDQKWQNVSRNSDLTDYAPGNYILQVYYDANGKVGSTTECGNFVFDSNDGNNYAMTFTIVAPLPVKLLDFRGNLGQSGIVLNWATAWEENFGKFEVERSVDGATFTTVGKVDGKGNSNLRRNYQYVDREFAAGANFYRLKQVDIDGEFSYSPVVKVNGLGRAQLKLSPNPTASTLLVEGVANGSRIIISDMAGRQVGTYIATGASMRISVSNLMTGKYMVTIRDGKTTTSNSFVKE